MKNVKMTVLVMVVVAFLNNQVMALTQFNDGGTHDITTAINDGVWVENTTTVNVVAGADILHDLTGFDNSQIFIYGGYLRDDVKGEDNSQITIYGGIIQDDLGVRSSATIYDGVIGGQVFAGDYDFSAQIIIYDGTIGSVININNNSKVDIYGGEIGGFLRCYQTSQLIIYGTDFNYPLGPITDTTGTLTGTLSNGDMINNDFYIYHNSSIVLLPEPLTLSLLGLGALFLRRPKA